MPTEPRLDPIVDTHAPILGRARRRVALASGFLVGVTGTAALVFALRPFAEAAPPIVIPPATTLTIPPPIVVTIEQAAPVPAAPPAATGLECPRITREDLPIGKPVSLASDDDDEGPEGAVVAAADAPRIAVRAQGKLWVSDDDGRSFTPTFTDKQVTSFAMDRGGVLYAASGTSLGVRTSRTKTTWRAHDAFDCGADCASQIGVLGDDVVWIRDTKVAVSPDRGRTWRDVDTSEYAWSTTGRLLPWRGALYQVEVYQDRCGVDDTHVHRLDANHRIAYTIFANYYNTDGPVLVADNETDATWSWRERCWAETGSNRTTACSTKNATRTTLLAAGSLSPVEGARTLAAWSGSVVELCGNGARQVYRRFPFSRIDAVDAVGRPLVMHERVLYRWSPVHGWRKLFTLPAADEGA